MRPYDHYRGLRLMAVAYFYVFTGNRAKISGGNLSHVTTVLVMKLENTFIWRLKKKMLFTAFWHSY